MKRCCLLAFVLLTTVVHAQPWASGTAVDVVYAVTLVAQEGDDYVVRWDAYPEAEPQRVPARHLRSRVRNRPLRPGEGAVLTYRAVVIEVGTGAQAGGYLVRWEEYPEAEPAYVAEAALQAHKQRVRLRDALAALKKVADVVEEVRTAARGAASTGAPADDEGAPADDEGAPADDEGAPAEGEAAPPDEAPPPGADGPFFADPAAEAGPPPAAGAPDPYDVFAWGVAHDLAGANLTPRLAARLAALALPERAWLDGLLAAATQPVEQVFILKALAAGAPPAAIAAYADAVRGLPAGVVVARSTMRDAADLIQQWHDACAPTVVQTALGEIDPAYAWALNAQARIDQVDPYGAGQALAAEQRAWLEAHGGVAVPRGQGGGRGIPLMEPLNAHVGTRLGVWYSGTVVADLTTALDRVAYWVQQGYDMPLCLSWSTGATAEGAVLHFVLVLQVQGAPGARHLLIHDPWTGKTAWVAEATLQQDRLDPIWDGYARVTHFYDVVPQ